jgi:hypothetical protein
MRSGKIAVPPGGGGILRIRIESFSSGKSVIVAIFGDEKLIINGKREKISNKKIMKENKKTIKNM